MKIFITSSFLILTSYFAWTVNADQALIYPARGHLSRTFAQMAASTAEKPTTLRVLFYGQSITAQKRWCEMIIADWQKRYPTVKFVVKNLAIGGYGTDSLVRTMESDIFPFYPDVLFFHDYGDVAGGYGHILGEVRRRTTAEIVVWSSHLRFDEKPANIFAIRAGEPIPFKGHERDHWAIQRTQEIRDLANELDLVFFDLQGHWCKLLMDNKWKPTELIGDTIHMNPKGQPYYAKIHIENLTPGPMEGDACGTITSVPFTKGAKVEKNGDITFAFEGNRVAAVANGEGVVEPGIGRFAPCGEVLIDGKPVTELASQWINTRSSPINNWFPGCDTPLKGNTALQDEKWTLTILSYVTNAKPKYVTYRLDGSKTGFDGEGCSTNLFVSKSGRIVIPGPWLGSTCNPWKIAGPIGGVSKTVWNSRLVPAPVYGPKPKGTETVLAQDLQNGKHTLTIRNPHGPLGIDHFIVNCPNPKWEKRNREPNDRVKSFRSKIQGAEFVYGDEKWH